MLEPRREVFVRRSLAGRTGTASSSSSAESSSGSTARISPDTPPWSMSLMEKKRAETHALSSATARCNAATRVRSFISCTEAWIDSPTRSPSASPERTAAAIMASRAACASMCKCAHSVSAAASFARMSSSVSSCAFATSFPPLKPSACSSTSAISMGTSTPCERRTAQALLLNFCRAAAANATALWPALPSTCLVSSSTLLSASIASEPVCTNASRSSSYLDSAAVACTCISSRSASAAAMNACAWA
mmetsp:Transcript_35840/g.89424  ORF Transcript_35840/g.89424 Transcript_35840/m.89424 type:complete len:248 (+) Transcript_35840:1258-2001(+)